MQRYFKIHRSNYYAILLISAHGTTIAALYPLVIPLWAKLALAICILLSIGYHLWRQAWLIAPSAFVSFILDKEQALLTSRSGKTLTGQLLHNTFCTPFLTILNVLPQGERFVQSVVIFPDSLDAASFRQLRIWLKWGAV